MFSLLPYEKYNWLAPAAQPLIPRAASLDGSAGNSGATLTADATAQGSHLPTSGLTWYGGGGSDDYSADDADNTLDGGAGSDEIHGNGGNDIIQDGESTTEMVITDFDDQEDTLAFHNVTRKHFGPVTSAFEMFTIGDLDTTGDGRIDVADAGWSLTGDGSSLRYETHYGASLVLEDVTSFEAEVLEVRWFIG